MSGTERNAKIQFIFILVHAFTKHYSHLGCQRKKKKQNTKTFTLTCLSAGALPTLSHILPSVAMEIQHNSSLNMNKA